MRDELARLRERLADVEAENADLKAELNAFDPKFFDEIEDLKHEHHMLSVKVSWEGSGRLDRERSGQQVCLFLMAGRNVPNR